MRELNAENIRAWLPTNQAIGLGLFLASTLLLFIVAAEPDTFKVLADGVYLGAAPISGVFLMMFSSFVMMVDGRRKQIPGELAELSERGFFFVTATVIAAGTYFLIARTFGFVIATLTGLTLSIYFLGIRSWLRAFINATVITAGLYYVAQLFEMQLF